MLLPALILGCKGDEPVEKGVEPVCPGPADWSAGTEAFREATSEWGLDGVEGVRFVAVDFDGDGWTDLHVHRGGDARDDFAGGVHQGWLLRNTGEGFEDVTESSGFRAVRGDAPGVGRAGSVVAFADLDNDGDLDAYTGVNDGANAVDDTSEIVFNRGDGTFELGARGGPLREDSGDVPSGASFTDVDRDGKLDLWTPQGSVNGYPQQDRLYLGDGAGGFDLQVKRLGLETVDWAVADDSILNGARAHSNAWSGAACDVDDDGRPDLLAASYGRAPNHLWMQQPDGTFLNQSVISGYAYDPRMDWTDNESARCWCTLHPTDADCEGVPAPTAIACDSDDDAFRWSHGSDRQPWRLGGNSACTSCGDVDNDGDLDLLTGEIVHWDVGSSSDPAELLLNDGTGVFERPGNDVTGLVREHTLSDWNDGEMTNALFDFDNDGWTDVYIGSSDYEGARGHLFRQVSPGRFEEVGKRDGIDQNRSHGVAVADFDRDGDLDVVVGHSLARCADDCYPTANVRLFLNETAGNFVQVSLVGAGGSNASAIGARLTLEADGFAQTHEVEGGHGHYGAQNDLVQHFGLGGACEGTLTVQWPDLARTTETFTVQAGHRFRIVQGQAPVLADP